MIKINETSLETAVLLIVFNRPTETEQVFDAIRQAKPKKLYIAIDAPRINNDQDVKLTNAVKKIVYNIDWECEVKTLEQDTNLGCRYGPVTAIDWFFDNETHGIILEDDCVPALSFFSFCQTLLKHYASNQQVMSITGTNVSSASKEPPDYFYSNYALMWGWTTWADRWEKYDRNLTTWPEYRRSNLLRNVNAGNVYFKKTWETILDRTSNDEFDAWDYQWIYTCWLHRGLTIVPNKNLITNIGFNDQATHTKKSNEYVERLPRHEVAQALTPPFEIRANLEIDQSINNVFFRINLLSYIKAKIYEIKLLWFCLVALKKYLRK